MREENDIIDDNAAILDSDYDDEEKIGDSEQTESDHKPVQLSIDPSIAEDEEKEQAAKENHVKMRAVLEGLLFLTGDDGLTLKQASQAMDLKTSEVEELFDELQKYYTSDERGFEIERYGDRYRFLSKAVVHDYAKKLFSLNKDARLSNAALETLAIIAYKQPVTRVEIEEIRGVGADVMLRKLEARGLIKEDGRSDAPGRPFLYSVTDEFMNAFQLVSLDELPDLPEFDQNSDGEGSDDLFTQ